MKVEVVKQRLRVEVGAAGQRVGTWREQQLAVAQRVAKGLCDAINCAVARSLAIASCHTTAGLGARAFSAQRVLSKSHRPRNR
jgi:hypothetical protein